MILFGLLFSYSQLSISDEFTRYAGTGGGFNIDPSINGNINVVGNPIIGSDGNKYFSVGPYYKEGITIDEKNAQAFGTVTCAVNFLVDNYSKGLYQTLAFHRVIAYMPEAGFSIKGLTAYKINSNTFFTLYSSTGITESWKNITVASCSSAATSFPTEQARYFVMQFSFNIRLYIKNIPEMLG